MNIVKELRDVSKWSEHGLTIDCGLNEDGRLCYRSRNHITGTTTKWKVPGEADNIMPCFTIAEMSKIVKAFEKLVVLL